MSFNTILTLWLELLLWREKWEICEETFEMLLVFKYSCCCLFFGSNATSKNLVIHYTTLFSSPLSASKRLMTKQSFVFSYILSPSFYPASPTTTYLPILSISILNWYTLFVLLEGQRKKKFYEVTFPVWKGYGRDSLLCQGWKYLGLKKIHLPKSTNNDIKILLSRNDWQPDPISCIKKSEEPIKSELGTLLNWPHFSES